MSTIIREGQTRNNNTGESVKFELLHGMDFGMSRDADISWTSFNLELLQYLDTITNGDVDNFNKLYTESQLEDSHWSWLKKAINFNTSDYEWFYYKAEDKIQGICVFYHPKISRIDKENVFYIEYVATAPWNRTNKMRDLAYKGIGSTLLRESLVYSIDTLGYRPGFSLHSLPQATSYYEKIGMLNFGPDPSYQNLIYLEMEQGSSEVFAYGR